MSRRAVWLLFARWRQTRVCLWDINCTGNFVQLPSVFGPKLRGITCPRETLWDPGGVGVCRLALCDDCFCLIALSQCILTCDPQLSCLPNMFLKNICNKRTIEWEVVSAASVISPCCVDFSPCLDVSRIKLLNWEGYYRPTPAGCRWTRRCFGYHSPCESHDPGEMSVIPGGWFGAALGEAVVLYNQRSQTHCRLLLQARDNIYVSHGSGK